MKKLFVCSLWAVSSLFWVTDAVKVPSSGVAPCETNDATCQEESVVFTGRRVNVDVRPKTVRGVSSTEITSRKGPQASSMYSSNTQSSSPRRAKKLSDYLELGVVAEAAGAACGVIGTTVGALIGIAVTASSPSAQPSQQGVPAAIGLLFMAVAPKVVLGSEAGYRNEDQDPIDYNFDDNTLGYCDLEKEEVVAIQTLMETEAKDLHDFFNFYVDWGKVYEYPIEEIRGFLKLVRKYLNPNANPPDRDILNTLTIKTIEGKDEHLSPFCQEQIDKAITASTAIWFALMGVGSIGTLEELSTGLPTNGTRKLIDTEAILSGVDLSVGSINNVTILPLFLDIMKADENVFNKFVEIILLWSAVRDVKTVMDTDFVSKVGSWKEAAATSKSFAAKYAAFAVTEGIDLIDPFFSLKRDAHFNSIYSDVVDTCSFFPPTPAPSSAPSTGVVGLDQFVPNIAVTDTTPAVLASTWESFRNIYPLRPFCVLQVRGGSSDFILPGVMLDDDNLIYKLVHEDDGNPDMQSDWYDLCELYRFNTAGRRLSLGLVDTVAINVVVAPEDVSASYQYFMARTDNAGLAVQNVFTESDSNWIQPFIRPFLHEFPSAMPSMAPSWSSQQPSRQPSQQPSLQPSQQPSPEPPTIPTPRLDSESCLKLRKLPEGNDAAILKLFGIDDVASGGTSKKRRRRKRSFTSLFDAACNDSFTGNDTFTGALQECGSQIKEFIRFILFDEVNGLGKKDREVFCFLYDKLNTTSWFEYAAYGFKEFNQSKLGEYFDSSIQYENPNYADPFSQSKTYREIQMLYDTDPTNRGLTANLNNLQKFWNTTFDLRVLKQATYFLYDDKLMLKVLRTAYGLRKSIAETYLHCAQTLFEEYNKVGEDFPLWTLNGEYFNYEKPDEQFGDGFVVLGGGLYQYYVNFWRLGDAGTNFILWHEIGHYLQDVYNLSIEDSKEELVLGDLCDIKKEDNRVIYDELLADALAAYYGNHPKGGDTLADTLEDAAQYSVYYSNCAADVRLTQHGTGIQRRQAVEFGTGLVKESSTTILNAIEFANRFENNYTTSICKVPVEGPILSCTLSQPSPGTATFTTGQQLYDILHCDVNLTRYPNISTWDVSQVSNFDSVFENLHFLNQNISTWDVSSATSMRNMFAGAFAFNSPLKDWDVSKVTDMTAMFRGAASFNQPIGLWNVGKVKNFDLMFVDAELFSQNLTDWNTGSATNMSKMFAMATFFDGQTSTWDVSNVQDFTGMFQEAYFFSQDISNWNTASATSMHSMFKRDRFFFQDIGRWNVGKVQDFSEMFRGAYFFDQNIGDWDTSSATSMTSMFDLAIFFDQDISKWNVSKVRDFSFMFRGFSGFYYTIFNQDIGNWDTSSATSMRSMLDAALDFNQDIGGWDVGKVQDFSSMFHGFDGVYYHYFNQPIGNWDTSSATNMRAMFDGAQNFTQDIGRWNVGKVQDFSYMFRAYNETHKFNQDIGNWTTSSATSMQAIFLGARSFDQNISQWNVGKVQDFSYMFAGTNEYPHSFNQDIGAWNTGSATDLSSMFAYNMKFNKPLGSWNVANVKVMNSMFLNATTFDQPLGSWNIAKVTNTEFMFFNATKFNQTLCLWTTRATNLCRRYGMFLSTSCPLEFDEINFCYECDALAIYAYPNQC